MRPPCEKAHHTSEDILVQVEPLLSRRHTIACGQERRVQEIGVAVVQLSTNPSQDTKREHIKRRFLSGSNVAENSGVPRKDVLAGTDDGDRMITELLVVPCAYGLWLKMLYCSNSPRAFRILIYSSR